MGLAREMSVKGRVSSDELAADPGSYLLCMRASYGVTKLLDKIGPERSPSRLVDVGWLLASRPQSVAQMGRGPRHRRRVSP